MESTTDDGCSDGRRSNDDAIRPDGLPAHGAHDWDDPADECTNSI